MREMKDSGIEWIGEIPSTWDIRKIGRLFALRNEKNYKPLEEVQLLSLYTDLGVFPHGEKEERGNKAIKAEGYKIVKQKDVIVNIILAWMGAIGISNYDGVTSPAYDVYVPNLKKVIPHFYHYVFRTTGIAGECYKYGRGIMLMRWRTYSSEFKQISIPFPSISEQQLIADCLDKKCYEIDTLFADIQSQIDTLEHYKRFVITEAVTKGLNPNAEMKDSDIEWIGKIPVNWDVVKLKYVSELRSENGVFYPDKDRYIGLENVVGYCNDLVETNTEYEISTQSICCENDVMFSKLRPYLAKVIISPVDGYCTSEFLQFKSFTGDKRYLRYSLLNDGFIDIVNSSTYGAKMPRANTNYIMNLSIAIPPEKVQIKIADFLDQKCKEIDDIIYNKNKQLEIIEEYRKSLIYEYVTGKKEV